MSAPTNTAIDRLLSTAGFDHPGPAEEFLPAVNVCSAQLIQRFPQYARFISQRSELGAHPTWETLNQLDSEVDSILQIAKSGSSISSSNFG